MVSIESTKDFSRSSLCSQPYMALKKRTSRMIGSKAAASSPSRACSHDSHSGYDSEAREGEKWSCVDLLAVTTNGKSLGTSEDSRLHLKG